MILLSPILLILLGWAVTCGVAGLAFLFPQAFDLVPVLMARNGLGAEVFTALGALWLSIGFLAYLAGDLAARWAPGPGSLRHPALDPDRAARIVFWTNAACLGITAFWITLSARPMGGLGGLVALTLADPLAARGALLDNKLFPGMRLCYAALPALGCLAAGLLARGGAGRRARRLCWAVLIVNAAALCILPVVMSQRLLLIQFLISVYVVTCLMRGRGWGAGWLFAGLAVFLAVWILREAVTNPTIDRAAVDLGLQKLAFYFVNDLWNAFAPLSAEFRHSLGGVSLQGLMVLTFTDGTMAPLLAPRLEPLEALRGGGEFPIFTAPFVDFGPVGAALFLALLGAGLRRVFQAAQTGFGWAAIYAQLGAGLLISSHGPYLLHQNVLVSLLIIAVVVRVARKPTRPRTRIAPQSPVRPVFVSRRGPAGASADA